MFMTFMAVAAVAVSRPAPPESAHFDCTGPVRAGMSAAAILRQFGKEARREIVRGDDGETSKVVVLYPDTPSRRLEVAFWDDAQTAVARVTDRAEATAWTGPLGLHAGSPMAEVVAVNGHNFSFTGFGWAYGGYITNVWNGRLLAQTGGCVAQVRLGLAAGIKAPRAIGGERELNSTLAEVKAAAPRVVELSIGWPLPAGVKVSEN